MNIPSPVVLLMGVLTGVLVGLTGTSGAFLIPIITLLFRETQVRAQGTALLLYVFFDSLASLYVISALFGLFQGGIVPSYAIIVREAMPAAEAATRVGIVIFASVLGMSFGGWVSGVIFDATGSYAAAFINGLAWNALNITLMAALLLRARASSEKADTRFAARMRAS